MMWSPTKDSARFKFGIKFDPHDTWLGLYWKRDEWSIYTTPNPPMTYTFYLCLVPCLPMIFVYKTKGD